MGIGLNSASQKCWEWIVLRVPNRYVLNTTGSTLKFYVCVCVCVHNERIVKTHNGEKTASSTNAAGKTGYPHAEDWN
jgi:hypothetical protein